MGGVNKAASTVLYSASKENSAIRGKDFLYAYPYIFTYLHTSVNLSCFWSLQTFTVKSCLEVFNTSVWLGRCLIRDFTRCDHSRWNILYLNLQLKSEQFFSKKKKQQSNQMKHFCHLLPLRFHDAASSWKIHSLPSFVASQRSAPQTSD